MSCGRIMFRGSGPFDTGTRRVPRRAAGARDPASLGTSITESGWIAAAWPGVKRLADVLAALGALLVLAPLFLAVMLAIKLDSRGPVFFRVRRRAARTPSAGGGSSFPRQAAASAAAQAAL